MPVFKVKESDRYLVKFFKGLVNGAFLTVLCFGVFLGLCLAVLTPKSSTQISDQDIQYQQCVEACQKAK